MRTCNRLRIADWINNSTIEARGAVAFYKCNANTNGADGELVAKLHGLRQQQYGDVDQPFTPTVCSHEAHEKRQIEDDLADPRPRPTWMQCLCSHCPCACAFLGSDSVD